MSDEAEDQPVAGHGAWRPLGALGLAMLSWLPSARHLLQGDLDLAVAATRFLVAVAVAWVGLGVVALVLRGYLAAPAANGAPSHPSRRRSDSAAATATAATADAPPPAPIVDVIHATDAIDVSATETSSEPV